jgi:hypothetical protein
MPPFFLQNGNPKFNPHEDRDAKSLPIGNRISNRQGFRINVGNEVDPIRDRGVELNAEAAGSRTIFPDGKQIGRGAGRAPADLPRGEDMAATPEGGGRRGRTEVRFAVADRGISANRVAIRGDYLTATAFSNSHRPWILQNAAATSLPEVLIFMPQVTEWLV